MECIRPVNPSSEASRVVDGDIHWRANVPRHYGDAIVSVHVRSFDFPGNAESDVTSIRPEYVASSTCTCVCERIFVIDCLATKSFLL